MKQRIQQHLARLEQEKQIRILFACETGSRAWGFASPDSDFDIRFIYVYPIEQYLSVHSPSDNISTIFEEAGEVLDFNGWELRKTLHQLNKSNPTVFEWIQSPVLYKDEHLFRSELETLAPAYFDARSTVHHYLGICHNSIKSGISEGTIKIKKYFYILRPLLAAMWAADRATIPPMEFHMLLDQIQEENDLMNAIEQLRKIKEKSVEGAVIALIPEIQTFIECEMTRCKNIADKQDRHAPSIDDLDAFFRKKID